MQNQIEQKDNVILEVKKLTCKFNENQANETIAVKNFSFEFEKNKIYFIIGNSGSGKSTLVTHFNGLLKSKKGNIRVDDFWIYGKKRKIKNSKKLRRLISMVFQFSEYQLFKTTIEKDISFGPVSLKIPKIKVNEINGKRLFEALSTIYFDEILAFFNITFKEDNFSDFNSFLNANELRIKFKIQNSRDCAKVKITNKSNLVWKKQIRFSTITESEYVHQLALKYLTKMGLDESYLDRSPFGLSGGQKKRVAIAGILAIEPKILVFDEPTAGLDPQGEQEMLDIILECKKNNQTIIVITHSMDHVLEVGDYVIVMDEGEIMMHGTPYKVFTNPNLYLHSKMEKPKVIDFIDSLVAKNSKFKQLYDLQPRNIVELTDAIQKIVAKSKTK